MNIRRTSLASTIAVVVGTVAMPIAHANLLVNGDFETSTNGFSTTLTPVGWANVGHSDGVLPYSLFNTPPYNGLYFYDLGGAGDASGPVGDGIEQTVATTPRTTYVLTFGVTSENGFQVQGAFPEVPAGPSTLQVNIGASFTDYIETSTGGPGLDKPFATEMNEYVATGASTTISFIEAANAGNGNNDPMIDGIIFVAVPEPASLAILATGLLGLGMFRRNKPERGE